MTTSDKKNQPIVIAIAGLLALTAIVYSAFVAIRFSGQLMLIRNFAFRETQTALTSYWACKDGFSFAYETPVAGAPWSIPFEFPIYQWIVSLISCPLGFGIERVGRLVSYAFMVACMLPAARISRSLFGERWLLYFAVFGALFFSAPLHIFFGRSVLMESAALFFSLYFIAYMISLIEGDRSIRTAVLAGVFLTLAILQKSTTVLPLVPVFGFWLLAVALSEIRADGLKSRALWLGIVAVLIPFLIGVVWAKYSDIVKEHNTFGTQLTSSALMQWNFGGDRLNWKLWLWVIWLRNIVTNIGGWIGVVTLAVGLIVLNTRHRLLIIGGAALFLLYFMIFTNLQFVHEYYQMSNETYLIFAVSVAIAGALASSSRLLSTVGVVALVTLVAVNIHTFRDGQNYAWMKEPHGPNDPVLAPALYVRDNTNQFKPIIVYGDDWSSEFPFYAQRKAFVVMLGFKDRDGIIAHPAKYVGQEPSAVMVCRDARTPALEARVVAGFKPTSTKRFDLCDIFLKG